MHSPAVTLYPAFTDIGSQNCGIAGWNPLNKDRFTDVFQHLGSRPMIVLTEHIEVLEKFLIETYYPKSNVTSLNVEREQHYLRLADMNIRNLPVSKKGLEEHVKRACYQAGWFWQEVVDNSVIQNPADWGWFWKEGQFLPRWQTSDDEIIDVYTAINVCSNCKKAKCERCKCKVSGMKCLPFCGCQRKCPNT